MRHHFDPWSLFFGLVFAGVAAAGLAGGLDRLWTDPDLWSAQMLVPAALILFGLLIGGFASAMLRRRSARDGRDTLGDTSGDTSGDASGDASGDGGLDEVAAGR